MQSAPQSSSSTKLEPFVPGFPFPKSSRILRTRDFRRVYDNGARLVTPLFTAFCLRNQEADGERGPRIGLTVPRAVGKAVARNRIKRRVREAVRLALPGIAGDWDIVINPRRVVLRAPFESLRAEIEKLALRCGH